MKQHHDEDHFLFNGFISGVHENSFAPSIYCLILPLANS